MIKPEIAEQQHDLPGRRDAEAHRGADPAHGRSQPGRRERLGPLQGGPVAGGMPAAPRGGGAGVCRRHDMPSINPVETPGELPGACEIVRVGGSIVGVSTAPFLTRQGTPVLPCVKGIFWAASNRAGALEWGSRRRLTGFASTGRPGGCRRCQWAGAGLRSWSGSTATGHCSAAGSVTSRCEGWSASWPNGA